MRSIRLVAVLLLTSLLVITSAAMAGNEGGTETLDMDDFISVHIKNPEGAILRVDFEVEVVDGVNVNVYFMDADGLEDYEAARDFEYHEEFSEEDTDDIGGHFVWDKEGDYYMVIDSSATEANVTSEVEYSVEWESAFSPGFNWLWCIVVIVIIVVITAALAFMRAPDARRERQEEELPPVKGDEGP
jgi:hypothetical protein